MIVYTAKERSRCVAADVLGEEMAASRVVIKEGTNIVNEPGDNDQGTLRRLLLDYVIEKSHLSDKPLYNTKSAKTHSSAS